MDVTVIVFLAAAHCTSVNGITLKSTQKLLRYVYDMTGPTSTRDLNSYIIVSM